VKEKKNMRKYEVSGRLKWQRRLHLSNKGERTNSLYYWLAKPLNGRRKGGGTIL